MKESQAQFAEDSRKPYEKSQPRNGVYSASHNEICSINPIEIEQPHRDIEKIQ